GSVAFLFSRLGEVVYKAEAATAESMIEATIEAGGDDVQTDAAHHVVTCAVERLGEVVSALTARLGDPAQVSVMFRPQTLIALDDDKASALMKLLNALEDEDDVQHVYSNFDISEEMMARLTAA
ncbi:MAG: YebC/PmpR family DNA-binding transcriptional regulator, partial [Pseudomonadota bacterium]|nr:YebC/PmpR family DNA-binding transcriptional regulator [Pseudomonadota bacterium]